MGDKQVLQCRAAAMLQALAVGDALGKVCSRYDEHDLLRVYGSRITHLRPAIRPNSDTPWIAGQVTDDTLLTLLVADSLIAQSGFDREDIARRMIACEPHGGSQIYKLKQSGDVRYRAKDGITNGAAIRVLPLALTYTAVEDVIGAVLELSTLTHGTNEAIGAAVVTALAQYAVFHDIPYIDFCSSAVGTVAPHLFDTRTWANLVSALAIAEQQEHPSTALEEQIGFGSLSWESVPTAIALGLTSRDPYACLIDCIHRKKRNGDLDTVASIACSLAGVQEHPCINTMARTVEEVNAISFNTYARQLVVLARREETI